MVLGVSAWTPGAVSAQGLDTSMSFFISSANPGKGANLGGLEGADAHCQALAEAVGADMHVWHAYLSTQGDSVTPGVNARDRIGLGPWYNAKGVKVAESVADLHSNENKLSKENSLTEKGEMVNGRGDSPNRHDILTGTRADGTAFKPGADSTCSDWTSETTGSAMVGHHDRHGIASNIDSTSWNQSHMSNGCSLANLVSTGGGGLIYCFASEVAVGVGKGRGGESRSPSIQRAWLIELNRQGGMVLQVPEGMDPRKAVFTVFSLDGRRLVELRPDAARREVDWNGRDAGGRRLAAGMYRIRAAER